MSLISLKNIHKTYLIGDIEVKAINGINLSIEKGGYTAIVGVSGSGKSTLMNIIGCLDRLTSGSYTLNSNNIEQMDDNDLSWIRNKEIGFVYQTFNLLSRKNVLDNVMLPSVYAHDGGDVRQAALSLIEKVGLSDRIHHKPNELSGGQKQRVAIARALINNPSILLADEPTGNLDSHTTRDIMKLFDRLHKEGCTIIMVTHETDIARHCKKVIHLKDGKIEKK
ncbi:ABC transporter ATP-binding protein [Spirochaetota bacterium]